MEKHRLPGRGAEQAARDEGLTGNDDPYVSFYHDVPRELAEEAMSKERAPVAGGDGFPVATRRVAERANEIRALHGGSPSSRPTSFVGWSRASEHHSRRDRERPLPRAQSSTGAVRPSGGLRGNPGEAGDDLLP